MIALRLSHITNDTKLSGGFLFTENCRNISNINKPAIQQVERLECQTEFPSEDLPIPCESSNYVTRNHAV